MALSDDLRQRLIDRVDALGGRVQLAADLASWQKAGGWPGTTPAAHVVPMGLAGGDAAPLTGVYRQKVSRLFSVFVTIRSHDASGDRWLNRIEDLDAAIMEAILGWGPLPPGFAFTLRRVATLRFETGTMVRELSFAIPDTLEIRQ